VVNLVVSIGPIQYQLTTSAHPVNSGSVTGGGLYNANAIATVVATPAPGYRFVSWTGPVGSATSASTTVSMTGPETVTAIFTAIAYATPTTTTVAAVSGATGQPVRLSAVVGPAGLVFAGSLQFQIAGENAGPPVTVTKAGTYTSNYTINEPPGAYAMTATLTSTTANASGSSGSNTLTVTTPYVRLQVSPNNPQNVAVNSPGGTAGPITLRGTVVPTGSGLNVGNADVTVTLVPVVGTANINCPVTNTGGALTATCATVPVNAYNVQWTLSGSGFEEVQVNTSLSVYNPALGSISGTCVALNHGVPFTLAVSGSNLNGILTGTLNFAEDGNSGNYVLVGTTPLGFSLVPGPGTGQKTAILTTLASLNGVPNYTVQATLVENAAGQPIQCGMQLTAPNGTSVTALSFSPVAAQLSMSVAPAVVGYNPQPVTLSANVFAPSMITGSIQFQVNGVNVGTPVPVNGSGIYTTNYAIAAYHIALSVDNTITAILTPTSGALAAVATNVLTYPVAVQGHILMFPYLYSVPVQTLPLTAFFAAYPGFVQFQLDGVNVGSPVPVTEYQATYDYTLPAGFNYSAPHAATATLLSINGVPLQTTSAPLWFFDAPG
jgi:hypothetical protein